MRRLVDAAGFVVLLAACGSNGTPQEQARPDEPRPVPRVIEPTTGAHGGAINALAVTADGRAAITGDTTGGLRLWPTLDGTREPVVISGPVAAGLAIVREGSGFAIAVTDSASHVVAIRVDNKGRQRARVSLGEAVQVEAVTDGFLMLRADQVIDHVQLDGSLRARLPAEPGTRVRSLAVHDAMVVALVDAEKQTTARTIDMAKLTWGKHSPALALVGEESMAVLTPDHKALLAIGATNRITRFELATGAAGKPVCPQSFGRFGRHGGFDELGGFGGTGSDVIAVPLDGKVGCLVDGTFSWFDVRNDGTTTVNVGDGQAALVMAGGGDRVVLGSNQQLVIVTPERTDFLGYGFRDLSRVRAVPTGLMIGKGDQEPILLDDDFKEHARFALPKARVWWTDLVPLDERYVLASTTRSSGGDLWGNAYQIGIYDIAKQAMHQVLSFRARSGELEYEPATQLLAASDGEDLLLVRLDAKKHALGDAITLAIPTVTKRVALTDPKLSGGLVALAIEDAGGGGLVVHELYASDLPPRQEVEKQQVMKPRRSYRISGELRAVDRAGRIFVHDVRDNDNVGVYVGGERRAELAGAHAARLRPSPDGKHVAAVEDNRVTLFSIEPGNIDGQRRWETVAWGSTDVDWTPRGILYARFPHALARIEVETGALVERQCGWGFGISTTSTQTTSNAPSVCDVL